MELVWQHIVDFFDAIGKWGHEDKFHTLIVAVGIFFVFILVRRLFTKVVLKNVERWVFKTQPYVQERILKELEAPLKFIPIIFGFYFALHYYNFEPGTDEALWMERFIYSLIIFNIFWAFYNLVHPISLLVAKMEHDLSRTVVDWIVRIVRFVLIVLGIATVLQKWGVPVASLIASLGIVGMAVALGAQDMFKNIFAGIAVITEKRFNVGDVVSVGTDIEGIVENIGFRSTLIRQFDKAPIYVPNTALSDAAVVNNSSRKQRRIKWVINLEYRTSAKQLRYIRDNIEEYIMKNEEEFAQPPEAVLEVRVDEFGSSSINLLVLCFTNTNTWTEWMKIKEDLAFRIKEIVEDETGAGFAFPSQSVYIEKTDKVMRHGDLKVKKRAVKKPVKPSSNKEKSK